MCVWKTKGSALTLAHELHGHTRSVTCLAVSRSWHIIVSGSADGTCIVWDINTGAYVHQLPGDPCAAVTAVCVNDMSVRSWGEGRGGREVAEHPARFSARVCAVNECAYARLMYSPQYVTETYI